MKAKVIKEYRDKYNKHLRRKNTIIEVVPERLDEINSNPQGPFLFALQREIPAEPEYEKMTKAELISLAEKRGIEVNSKSGKAAIITTLKGGPA